MDHEGEALVSYVTRKQDKAVDLKFLKKAMLRFRRMRGLQKFATNHSSFRNHLNLERQLHSRLDVKQKRDVALNEWRDFDRDTTDCCAARLGMSARWTDSTAI